MPMGIVTQTLADLHNAPSQPEPVSDLSQVIHDQRNSSSTVTVDLPSFEEDSDKMEKVQWGELRIHGYDSH
jgi:hypothetical protein